jgi:bacterioferritin-associated ferredoxin
MCKAVKSSEVTEMLEKGACSVEDISHSCGAGTDCGSCLRRLQKAVDDHQRALEEVRILEGTSSQKEAV